MFKRKTKIQITGAAAIFLILVTSLALKSEDKTMKYNQLTPEEENVIIHKATERPYTGKYLDNKEAGVYTCKRCGAELYRSTDKFDSHCGWPSFDDEIPGAVKRVPDADGFRTEIICANCGGHLGHVFEGEGYTAKNVRFCVNSISLNFIPEEVAKNTEKAYFAGGCFWGVEYLMQMEDGVISVKSGYMGGTKANPTYQEVCGGKTGHAETVEIEFDPALVSYEKLARLFFEIHDPTQVNRQGPDIGSQYRSEVFYTGDKQKQTAEKLIRILEAKGLAIATKVAPAGTFWPAEGYHQDYYDNNSKQPYCHVRVERF